jgi:8-oxo-dGTP pyrophosphatase MutT (NUDIX family)
MSPLFSALSRAAPPRRHTQPQLVQLAALCWRKGEAGREVLLVTSSSGRWILPKGWPMQGKTHAEAALTEAWEEGGIARGKASRKPVGDYMAIKRTAAGDDIPCLHHVYAIKVRETVEDFPEAHRRDRAWVSPEDAAGMVDEDGLKDILRNF